jgi:hypothetical protein
MALFFNTHILSRNEKEYCGHENGIIFFSQFLFPLVMKLVAAMIKGISSKLYLLPVTTDIIETIRRTFSYPLSYWLGLVSIQFSNPHMMPI